MPQVAWVAGVAKSDEEVLRRKRVMTGVVKWRVMVEELVPMVGKLEKMTWRGWRFELAPLTSLIIGLRRSDAWLGMCLVTRRSCGPCESRQGSREEVVKEEVAALIPCIAFGGAIESGGDGRLSGVDDGNPPS